MADRWRRGSITRRVTATAAVVSAFGLTVVLGGLYLVVEHQLAGSFDDGLAVRTAAVVAVLREDGLEALNLEPYVELHDRGTVTRSALLRRSGQQLLPPDRLPNGDQQLLTSHLRLASGSDPVPLRVLADRLPDGRVLVLGQSLAAQEEAAERRLVGLLITGPLLLLLIVVTVGRSVRAALRPVDDLTREAARISAADDTSRLPTVNSDDEIARLACTLDAMLTRLHGAFRRERAFVDDASHELRTPVAVIRGELELALSDLADTDAVETSLRAAFSETERLQRLAEDLLVLARQRPDALVLRLTPVDLRALLENAAQRLSAITGLDVDVTCPAVTWTSDSDRLNQVLTNLAVNAAAAGARHLRLHAAVEPASATVRLRVDDDGPGFPADFLDRAFDRFSRADTARTRAGSTGLGLALVAAIVAALGGTVTARNDSPLGGASVRLSLPTAPSSAPPS